MCAVSMVGDGWTKDWVQRFPTYSPPSKESYSVFQFASKTELEALKKEVEELKILLLAAKRFDEATGQPNCEMEDKVKLIKSVAEMLGVDMGDVFKESDNVD